MGTVLLDKITKMYGDTVGVKDLSLQIEEEEFFVLVGPSGAGKTTTLKTVAGLLKPTAGRLYIDGKLSNLVKPNERNVSMTFESYALYPHFSVYDNIANPLRSPKFKIEETKVDKEVKRIANMLEIGHLLDRKPGELSGGQKQRVSLGRAMVRKPSVFLLDEPLSHVDAKVRHRMRVELNKLQRELKTTTIYVTHDYVEGLSLGDRVGVIRDGHLEQVGKPKDVYNIPKDEFVAKHLGFPEIDIVTAAVKSEEDGIILEVEKIPSMTFRLTKKQCSMVKEYGKKKVRVGIRPQMMKIVPKSQEQFIGTVYAFNPFITYGVLVLEIGGVKFNVLTAPNKVYKVDEHLSMKVNPSDIYLFDVDTKQNLAYL